MKKILLSVLITFSSIISAQDELIQIRPFGTNPGNLKLMFYDPGNISQKSPLVVVLHGCTQTAKACAEQSGWNKLAKLHQFYVLYPEQLVLNNPENCFNWYRSADQSGNKGEPASIMQMINYLKINKNIDSTQIYIIGLSAGGAMSSIMMAVFPEVFNKGGVMAGGPYKSAESVINAGPSMLGMVSKSPEEWGDLIRNQNPNYKGKYPELIVFHGSADPVVSTNNSNQLIKQWVNIHGTDYEADEHFEYFRGKENVELTIYKNKTGENVVNYFKVRGIGHTLPLDTGTCSTQGGKTALFASNVNFHSTFWAADFFGIIKQPYQLNGPSVIKPNSTINTYSVPFNQSSVYNWNTPAGMWILGPNHQNSIQLQPHFKSGVLEVNEINQNGCEMEPCRLWIEVKE